MILRRRIWSKTFPEFVHAGGNAWRAGLYQKASDWYWLAAFVAPTAEHETRMLMNAWIAHERAAGRASTIDQEVA